jgi:peptidoglycan/xylan/chitin deacetylase (PgdA/CDA1 family)
MFDRLINAKLGRDVVLYYHSVKPSEKIQFQKQLDLISEFAEPSDCMLPSSSQSKKHRILLTFDDGFHSFIDVVLPELIKRKIPAIMFVSTGHIGNRQGWITDPAHRDWNEYVMTAARIKKLSLVTGIQIGSHCISHKRLTDLADSESKAEIFDSKKTLENITGRSISLLSFPHGDFNANHLAFARMAGFRKAFSISPNHAHVFRDDFLIGRVKVDPYDSRWEFLLKIHGAYRWLPAASKLKKSILSALNKQV